MNNVLVTGANGQLGSEIKEILAYAVSENNYLFTDVAELDITDLQAVRVFVKNNNIHFIINCAAYTNVDKAEEDVEIATKINYLAVENLAIACKEQDIFVIHISTDYVFDGTSHVPYKEDVATIPLGVYGKTKLDGEKALLKSGCSYIIIRTSWLYSSYGNNFVKTMKRLTSEKEMINVVFDQVGTPTYAADLAQTIVEIIEKGRYKQNSGIYHFSNEGVCSWYDFAIEIRNQFGNICEIFPCHSEEFLSKVKRPNYSVLDKSKIKETFGINIPYWKDSLVECIKKLK